MVLCLDVLYLFNGYKLILMQFEKVYILSVIILSHIVDFNRVIKYFMGNIRGSFLFSLVLYLVRISIILRYLDDLFFLIVMLILRL